VIPFVDLKMQYARLAPRIDARIRRVLEHGQYILGPEVAELEAALAEFCGAKHAVSLASGTEALRVPMMAENIGPGDAVFMPAFTFTATAEVPVAQGAEPVFVDVDADTFLMSIANLERQIARVKAEGRLRPRAVVTVDLFGQAPDYGAVNALCRREGLFLLADAAQSFGARRDNSSVGVLAPVTATSFFPAKPLGGYGDGGAVFTDDADVAEIYRSIRVHGAGADRYDIVRLGTNARLDTLQASILLAKLEIFPEELERREAVARAYDRLLGDIVEIPARVPHMRSAWAQYTIKVDRRAQVAGHLKQAGIPTAVYYPKPLHLQPAYAVYGQGEGSMPVSESLSARVLSLPMHPYLDDATIERIANELRKAIKA
jgi:dTDP-4-amino-4,6-dideoxygalactose transaminase